MSSHVNDTIEAIARHSYGKLIAYLTMRTRDVAAAEDALSDAFAAALVDWPAHGCPSNPEAWLFTAARRKATDAARRRATAQDATRELLLCAERDGAETESPIPDHRLALMFACAHPAIDPGVRAPLMLQVILGLNAETVASPFLASPAAMARKLTRAKDKIRNSGIPFRIPEREELQDRLGAVLDAVYAAFAEGWTDPTGTDAARRDLTGESIYLARVVTELLPQEPEPLGLLALMLHAEARRPARRTETGDYVPLEQQDTLQWDAALIDEAERLLHRASAMGALGRYQLEGALQSAHVHRRRSGESNWPAVLQLYDALCAIAPSPVAALNRTLALTEVQGPAAALQSMEELASDPRLEKYQPYWAARAELLTRTGRHEDARHAYDVAIGLERDPAVRRFLQTRAARIV